MRYVWNIYETWVRAEPSAEWKARVQPDPVPHEGEGQACSRDSSDGHGTGGGTRGPEGMCNEAQEHWGGTARSPEQERDSSLGPGDSASCRADSERSAEKSDDDAPPADEEEEWEDPEFFASLEAWADDVWRETRSDKSRTPCSEKAEIGPTAAGKDRRSCRVTLVVSVSP
ncbi:hypothetical protein BD626DRAFT_481121 [Schizophyllum amplum]|uniref:Uncharacterized protein n=1 Tax=Schizophyllum amplum TaxID=97359 RepID=A0A550CTV9_9AGAR|nr:hypothetical protein BD626DRAFT_481121 [Auriculariopsis ampla]